MGYLEEFASTIVHNFIENAFTNILNDPEIVFFTIYEYKTNSGNRLESFKYFLQCLFKKIKIIVENASKVFGISAEDSDFSINKPYVNVLLLGETGVGKSTFINSIANYLTHSSLEAAINGNCTILIPTRITLTDRYRRQITINVGNVNDTNECCVIGASATQNIKTYVFPIQYNDKETRLRLIDTPGVGDCRGLKQDEKNCENILNYLKQLQQLDAICFLLKSGQARNTVAFEYCIKQIFSRLDKSASKNLIFIFTNTRGTNYDAGETLQCLASIINRIKTQPPHVEIALNKNVFCLDNEGFRYLAGVKHGIVFDDYIKTNCATSWKKSSLECRRLFFYIVGNGIEPHQLSNTIRINEARKLIFQLSQPLAEIMQLINDNLYALEKHRYQLQIDNKSLEELSKQLYMPIIDLQINELDEPMTVCASAKCAEIYNVGSLKKWHYKQQCHYPCRLINIAAETIGDAGLVNCAAMDGNKKCTKCNCDFSTHMHIYYYSTTINRNIADYTVAQNIVTKATVLEEKENLIKNMESKRIELERENDFILTTTAEFAYFLQNNAITPFNDSYKSYIEHLITRELSLGPNADKLTMQHLEKSLEQYEACKKAFDISLNSNRDFSTTATVNSETIFTRIGNLYQLKHTGGKIREIMTAQSASREREFQYSEYVHKKITIPRFSSKSDDDVDSEANKSINPNMELVPPPLSYTGQNSQSNPMNVYPNINQFIQQPQIYPNLNPAMHINNDQYSRIQPNYSQQPAPHFSLKSDDDFGSNKNKSVNTNVELVPSPLPYTEHNSQSNPAYLYPNINQFAQQPQIYPNLNQTMQINNQYSRLQPNYPQQPPYNYNYQSPRMCPNLSSMPSCPPLHEFPLNQPPRPTNVYEFRNGIWNPVFLQQRRDDIGSGNSNKPWNRQYFPQKQQNQSVEEPGKSSQDDQKKHNRRHLPQKQQNQNVDEPGKSSQNDRKTYNRRRSQRRNKKGASNNNTDKKES